MSKTKELKVRIDKARKKAEKNGEIFTIEDQRKIEKRFLRHRQRENRIRAIFLALGISIGGAGAVAGTKLLEEAKDVSVNRNAIEREAEMPSQSVEKSQNKTEVDKSASERNDFVARLQESAEKDASDEQVVSKEQTNDIATHNDKTTVDTPSTKEQTNKVEKTSPYTDEDIINEIVDKYNETNGTDLGKDDYSYMKTAPSWLGIKDDGTYVQDYKQQVQIQDYTYNVGPIYNIIDTKNDKIIASISVVNGQISGIYSNVVMDSSRKEYFHAENEVDLNNLELNENRLQRDKLDTVYGAISSETEKVLEDKNKSKENDTNKTNENVKTNSDMEMDDR